MKSIGKVGVSTARALPLGAPAAQRRAAGRRAARAGRAAAQGAAAQPPVDRTVDKPVDSLWTRCGQGAPRSRVLPHLSTGHPQPTVRARQACGRTFPHIPSTYDDETDPDPGDRSRRRCRGGAPRWTTGPRAGAAPAARRAPPARARVLAEAAAGPRPRPRAQPAAPLWAVALSLTADRAPPAAARALLGAARGGAPAALRAQTRAPGRPAGPLAAAVAR